MGDESPALVVGLAGHVDHGKTSLVRALTGTDTDRLEEERRRGLTIELGFAHMSLATGRRVSFVDVPGHERFVRTMAAGVSGIDAAMVVVDAREGVRAQTREHADILRLLGTRRVIGVISKCDLAGDERIAEVEQQLRALLGRMIHRVVSCSAKSGAGLDRLTEALDSLVSEDRALLCDAPFRMPADRVFRVHGSGTVVTGTSWQGTVRVGDVLACAGSGSIARVKGLECRGASVEAVGPGQRTAMNLAIEWDTPERGEELVARGAFAGTRRVTLALELLPSFGRTLRTGARVLAMLGTRAEPAVIRLVGTKRLEPGDGCLAQLVFTRPVVVTGGQRILIRTGSPETTIGGGEVRSVFAPLLAGGDGAWIERMLGLAGARASEKLATAAWALGERSWDEPAVCQEAGVWGEALPGVEFAGRRIDSSRMESLIARVAARVESLSDGGSVERSRVIAALRNRAEQDVHAALDHLVRSETLVETPAGVSLADSEERISESDRASIERIREVYKAYGAAPLPVDDIATSLRVRVTEARRLVRLASERGALVHVSGPLYLESSVARSIGDRVRLLIRERGGVKVSDVREMLGVTRKHAVPICEHLDRVRVTRRVGDHRVLYHETDQPGAGNDG